MKIEEVKKRKRQTKNVPINLRITQEVSDYLRENEISPQRVFDLAVIEIREKKE